jgi:GTP-binding protein Era
MMKHNVSSARPFSFRLIFLMTFIAAASLLAVADAFSIRSTDNYRSRLHDSFLSRPTRFTMQATPENLVPDANANLIKKSLAPKADLMKELDGSFQYEGRLQGESYQNADYRCGFVSIIGAPNMGKSTLLNALIKEELCIATARPQTTRHAILGLLNTDQCQVCLVDTPGVIDQPAYKLQEGMMEAVIGALHDADILLVVTDLFSTPIPDDELFQKVVNSKKPVLVCVNKVDLAGKVNKNSVENEDKTMTVEDAIARWRQLLPNALAILPLVASNGPDDVGVLALRTLLTGGPDLPAALRNLGRPVPGMFLPDVQSLTDEDAQAALPLSPPLYDTEILTDRPSRFIASEIIRAALFQSLQKELPYCCEVQIESFKDPEEEGELNDDDDGWDGPNKKKKKKPVIRISAAIFVERDSQKVIVIGKNGQQIKKVGIAAREKLEDFFQMQVCTVEQSLCFVYCRRGTGVSPITVLAHTLLQNENPRSILI